jgi:hypothetical protein
VTRPLVYTKNRYITYAHRPSTPYVVHGRKRKESALEQWCVKWARSRGIVVAKLTELSGVPDRIFFTPKGRPLIVEFKKRNEKPDPLQEYYLKKLLDDGYHVGWCEARDGFLTAMKERGVK